MINLTYFPFSIPKTITEKTILKLFFIKDKARYFDLETVPSNKWCTIAKIAISIQTDLLFIVFSIDQ